MKAGWRWCARWAGFVFLLVGACHPPPPPPLILRPVAFTITGRVIALFPPRADGEHQEVIVGPTGTPYRVWVRRLTGVGTQHVSGDSVTAWVRIVGVDTLADSVRVERRP